MNKPERIEGTITAELMRAHGRKARVPPAAAGPRPTDAKNAALRAAAQALRKATPRFSPPTPRTSPPRRQPAARRRSSTGSCSTKRGRGHGRGPRRDRRVARSGRHGARAIGRGRTGSIFAARARAARRHRHHLRKPPERNGGRRRAVPESGQRGDPARRLGKPSTPRAPSRPACGEGLARRRAARGRDAARADDATARPLDRCSRA